MGRQSNVPAERLKKLCILPRGLTVHSCRVLDRNRLRQGIHKRGAFPVHKLQKLFHPTHRYHQ